MPVPSSRTWHERGAGRRSTHPKASHRRPRSCLYWKMPSSGVSRAASLAGRRLRRCSPTLGTRGTTSASPQRTASPHGVEARKKANSSYRLGSKALMRASSPRRWTGWPEALSVQDSAGRSWTRPTQFSSSTLVCVARTLQRPAGSGTDASAGIPSSGWPARRRHHQQQPHPRDDAHQTDRARQAHRPCRRRLHPGQRTPRPCVPDPSDRRGHKSRHCRGGPAVPGPGRPRGADRSHLVAGQRMP